MQPDIAAYFNSSASTPGIAFCCTCLAPEVDPACPLSELNRVLDGQVGVSFNGQQFTTQDVDLYYYGVLSLFPSHGPLSGGTVVSVTGPNLQHGFNDQLEMACLLMGELVVSVSARYACPRASAQSQTQFLVYVCRRHSSGSHAAAPVCPDGIQVRAFYHAQTQELTCTVPARPENLEATYINLEIRLQDVPNAFTEDLVLFSYYTDPTLMSMGPKMAPRIGGVELYVVGVMFFEHPDMRCRFGGQGGHVVKGYLNKTISAVVCMVPPWRNALSRVLVEVTQNAQQYIEFRSETMFLDYYGIDSVSPVAGPLPASNSAAPPTLRTLTISGQNLRNYDTSGAREGVQCLFRFINSTHDVGNQTMHTYTTVKVASSSLDIGRQQVQCQEPHLPGKPTGPMTIDLDLGQTPLGLEGPSVSTQDRVPYHYYSHLTSSGAVLPAVGLETGGTIVDVTGTLPIYDFHDSLQFPSFVPCIPKHPK